MSPESQSFFLSCGRAQRLFQPFAGWEGGGNAELREQTGSGRLALALSVSGEPPSAYVTRAHPLPENQTPTPGIPAFLVLALCDHFLLCSLADSGSAILFFRAPLSLSRQFDFCFLCSPCYLSRSLPCLQKPLYSFFSQSPLKFPKLRPKPVLRILSLAPALNGENAWLSSGARHT